jgi:hypothetical protein
MLTSGVVLLHGNARPVTAAHTGALLELFNWEVFDHFSYSPDLAPSYHRLFIRIYPRNWLGSQRFNNNEFIEIIKTCLDFFDTGVKNLFPNTSDSIRPVTTLK